mmetsp:Transcript_37618/g.69460  ORF Transcript_37618/g.69460 Transcript_37618/m.69460 type:complete len:557 (+) Transcript_37618:76-1746(+)
MFPLHGHDVDHSSKKYSLKRPESSNSGSVIILALTVFFCAAGAGAVGFLLGLTSHRRPGRKPVHADHHHRLVDPIATIGRPFVESGLPLWSADYAELHGAAPNALGLGLLYYTLAYVQKPGVCVVIGEGMGFVPALVRRGQVASGMAAGKTYVIDDQYDLEFRQALPEIEVLTMPSIPQGIRHLLSLQKGLSEPFIDYLHIDGSHTHRGHRQEFEQFSRLLVENGIVTLHNTDAHPDEMELGVNSLVAELKQDPCWELVDFKSVQPYHVSEPDQFGAGTAVLRKRCPNDMRKDLQWAAIVEAPSPANAVSGGKCSDHRALPPLCLSCVPGTSSASDCSAISPKVAAMREEAARQALAADVGAAAVYTASPERHELRAYVLAWLLKTQPRRVLDLGTYLDPLESFSNFTYGGWCPELVVSVDPLLAPVAKTLECGSTGSGRQVRVVHSPMAVEDALHDSTFTGTAFDAVLCLGCHEVRSERVSGFAYDVLEKFKRPYQLFVEFSEGDELSKFPKRKSGRIINERQDDQAFDGDRDMMRVIYYSDVLGDSVSFDAPDQ